jgi:hypothetical protein
MRSAYPIGPSSQWPTTPAIRKTRALGPPVLRAVYGTLYSPLSLTAGSISGAHAAAPCGRFQSAAGALASNSRLPLSGRSPSARHRDFHRPESGQTPIEPRLTVLIKQIVSTNPEPSWPTVVFWRHGQRRCELWMTTGTPELRVFSGDTLLYKETAPLEALYKQAEKLRGRQL